MSSEAVITDASALGSELETSVGETLALGRERPHASQPQDEADVVPLRTGTPFLNAYFTGTSLMSFDGGVTRFAAVGPPRTGSGYSDGMVG